MQLIAVLMLSFLVLGFLAIVGWSTFLIHRRRHRENPPFHPKIHPVSPSFTLQSARPRPYRPFRWNYHQTMALHTLDLDYWIELDSQYLERIKERKALYSQYGTKILDLPDHTQPQGKECRAACEELMHTVIDFLCTRYPHLFSLSPDGRFFQNHILSEMVDLEGAESTPLHFLLDHVPEDFCILMNDPSTPEGRYVLRAGVICCAVGWNLGDKMGLSLDGIHEQVPKYSTKLQPSMNRYFTKLKCDKPIQRAAWSLQVGQHLFLQTDDPLYSTPLPSSSSSSSQLTPQDNIHLRVDWQTLRRLPLSGAIVFNFKAFFTPLLDLQHEPYIPRLFHTVLTRGDEEILNYKGVGHFLHKVVPALEEWAQEQVEKGWVPRDWQVKTLDEEPFFPGWQNHWIGEER